MPRRTAYRLWRVQEAILIDVSSRAELRAEQLDVAKQDDPLHKLLSMTYSRNAKIEVCSSGRNMGKLAVASESYDFLLGVRRLVKLCIWSHAAYSTAKSESCRGRVSAVVCPPATHGGYCGGVQANTV